MPKVTIDQQEYEIDDFTQEARTTLEMLLLTDQRLRELQRDLAITQTARAAYAKAVQDKLPAPVSPAADSAQALPAATA
jgi:hypothetical protein